MLLARGATWAMRFRIGGFLFFLLLSLAVNVSQGGTQSPPTTPVRTTTTSSTTTAPASSFCAPFSYSVSLLAAACTLCWNRTATSIDMGLDCSCSGWVAFGITNQAGGGMTNADIVMCTLAGCTDRWSTSRTAPQLDTQSNFVGTPAVTRSGGRTQARFQRLLSTGDSAQDRPIVSGLMEVMVAYHLSSDTLSLKHSDKVMTYVDFTAGTGAPPGVTSTPSTAQIVVSNYDYSATFLSGLCGIYWKIVADSINIGIECYNGGWIGFGLSSNGAGMTNSDIWIARVVGNVMTISDYQSTSQATPALDAIQDLTGVTGSRVNGKTTVMFTRKLNTGDATDRVIQSGVTECIVAVHPTSDLLLYHGIGTREYFYVNFFTGVAGGTSAPVASPVDSSWNPADYPNRINVFGTSFELYWSVGTSIIDFAVRASGPAVNWVGVGISPAGTMVSADIVLCWFDQAGAPIIQDSSSVSTAIPVADVSKGGANNLVNTAGSRNATGMTFKWRRAYVTGDAADQPITVGPINLIFAYGDTATPTTHTSSARVAMSVDLRSGAASSLSAGESSLKAAHGFLMAIGFGGMMVAGIFVACFVPKDKTWWFPVHWILQAAASTLILIGFAIALAFQSNLGAPHFQTSSITSGAHSIIGIITISLVAMQVILGIVADRVWQSEHKKTNAIPETKVFPDKVHWWLGRSIALLAVVTVFLGIAEFSLPWWWYLIWALVIVAWVAAFVLGLYILKSRQLSQSAH